MVLGCVEILFCHLCLGFNVKEPFFKKKIQAMLKFISSLVLLLFCCTFTFASALQPPKEGEPLIELVLPAPPDAGWQRYLGVI